MKAFSWTRKGYIEWMEELSFGIQPWPEPPLVSMGAALYLTGPILNVDMDYPDFTFGSNPDTGVFPGLYTNPYLDHAARPRIDNDPFSVVATTFPVIVESYKGLLLFGGYSGVLFWAGDFDNPKTLEILGDGFAFALRFLLDPLGFDLLEL
jgi:hypothetical protein